MIHFEDKAVARLRERLGAVEEANEDLIAFARGHWGAVASIHSAVLAALDSQSLDELLRTIGRDWPGILGIDCAAITFASGSRAFRADGSTFEEIEAGFVHRMIAGAPRVEVRPVRCGHPLFGQTAAPRVRAEALVRIDSPCLRPVGLLALGQHATLQLRGTHGTELLLFLGRAVGAVANRFASAHAVAAAPEV